jgi:CRP-like cAMP-binding protein
VAVHDAVVIEMGVAESRADREAVFRFWYSVYVEELGRYQLAADHERRMLIGPEDDRSWIFFARDGDDVVAGCRMSWGGDGFSDRQIAQYSLRPFLRELPAEHLAIGERAMVAASHRGGSLYGELGVTTGPPMLALGVLLTFGASEPHLVTFYAELGMRPYAQCNAFSEESGYLIPNVVFAQGVEIFGDEPPECVRQILSGDNAVNYALQDGEERYAARLRSAVAALPDDLSVLAGLDPQQLEAIVARSVIIRCAAGDQILAIGGTARNPFVVLTGRLETRGSTGVTTALGPGAMFGESGMFGSRARTADVVATEDGAEILALSERSIRAATQADPQAGSTLHANIAAQLWRRLQDAGGATG